MDKRDIEKLRRLASFANLVDYLSDELDWPIDVADGIDLDSLTFEYEPEELDIDPRHAVKIEAIKQIRPLVDTQPWGVFYIEFESKHLPVVVLRRILQRLVPTSRQRAPDRPAWQMENLLFICAQGEPDHRSVSFAHFRQGEGRLPELRTFSWDAKETHFYYIKNLNLEALRWPDDESDQDAWNARWSEAFPTAHRAPIATAQELATRMAELAAETRTLVNETYQVERKNGPLHRLYDSFRRVLIHDLSVDDFADMYAQTVTYGLLSARATHSGEFSAATVTALVPRTNPFLRDLLDECLKVGTGRRHALPLDELGVDELVETLRDTDVEAILREFDRQSREHKEDPVIHFYESFLRAYDARKKAKRGVFYTPDPVVSFIVRSVDHLLRTEFDCPDGLADTGTMEWQGQQVPRVQILDPATGTGTFLKHVIEQIQQTLAEKYGHATVSEQHRLWNEYVAEHLLPRLYGFELMMAPYAVAHMKLGLALRETGYDFASDERLRVYLTNALQPAHEIPRTETPFLAAEAQEANRVRMETPITVVIGNPPYSNFGQMNRGPWILDLLQDYKKGLHEKKLNLDDDFIKFLRFAQWRIAQTGQGIVAMITNNTYIDGITHRRLRESLMDTFSDIYILDLHGSSKKKEVCPDGSKDENVFDIQQGAAIVILVKKQESGKPVAVYHSQLWGRRESKYSILRESNLQSIEWSKLQPCSSHWFFIPRELDLEPEYERFWRLSDFSQGISGIETKRDHFALDFDLDELRTRVFDFVDGRYTDIQRKRRFGVRDNEWNVADAVKALRGDDSWRASFYPCIYRPFDQRWIIYSGIMLARDRGPLMAGMTRPNLGLVAARQSKEAFAVLASATICTHKIVTVYDRSFIFPLYVYGDPKENAKPSMQATLFDPGPEVLRRANFSSDFLADLQLHLNLRFVPDGTGDLQNTLGPEDIFHYIYAVFHAPTYRTRYAEFLKIDFPRLPLTRNLELFRALCARGAELVALHLLESPILEQPITRYVGAGDHTVAKGYPKYSKGTVWINTAQGFQGVPEEVWAFQIGGYQVCHKWLKDRRGRVLSAEDRARYARIVVALKETIRLMAEIDEVIEEHGGWPIQ